MSTLDIKPTEKVKVFLRLLDNNEDMKIACSKAGLNVKVINKFLFV